MSVASRWANCRQLVLLQWCAATDHSSICFHRILAAIYAPDHDGADMKRNVARITLNNTRGCSLDRDRAGRACRDRHADGSQRLRSPRYGACVAQSWSVAPQKGLSSPIGTSAISSTNVRTSLP